MRWLGIGGYDLPRVNPRAVRSGKKAGELVWSSADVRAGKDSAVSIGVDAGHHEFVDANRPAGPSDRRALNHNG